MIIDMHHGYMVPPIAESVVSEISASVVEGSEENQPMYGVLEAVGALLLPLVLHSTEEPRLSTPEMASCSTSMSQQDLWLLVICLDMRTM